MRRLFSLSKKSLCRGVFPQGLFPNLRETTRGSSTWVFGVRQALCRVREIAEPGSIGSKGEEVELMAGY